MPRAFIKAAFEKKRHGDAKFMVPSAPLGYLLRAAGVSAVDLFSLDVEGSELRVLQTMDWSIPVRVWCIEVQPERRTELAIAAIMQRHGYRREHWRVKVHGGIDHLWVRGGSWPTTSPPWKPWDGGDAADGSGPT